MQKKHLILFGLLVMCLCATTSCARISSTTDSPVGYSSNGHEWNLPVAISAGIELDQLGYLTDDEIRLLHQPYVDIVNSISNEYGVNMEIGTFDCYFTTRDDILYTITNVSLAEIDLRHRELAEQLRGAQYSSKLIEAILDSEYGHVLGALLRALEYRIIDPVDAYHHIQQDGVTSFIEGIEHILQ